MFNMCMWSFSAKSFTALIAPLAVRRMCDPVLRNDNRRLLIWGSSDLLGLHLFLIGGNLLACCRFLGWFPHIACILSRIAIQDTIGVKTGAYEFR